MSLYGIQLVMNLAWSPIFFKQHDIGFALLDVTALLGVLTATVVEFHRWESCSSCGSCDVVLINASQCIVGSHQRQPTSWCPTWAGRHLLRL